MSTWTYRGKPVEHIDSDYEGFVYLITNTVDHKIKRRGHKESDWRDYWGSSDHLCADVERLGEDKFTREILYMCKSRGEMSYLEAREQFERRVLETDSYYNGIINVRVGGSKILRERLQEQCLHMKQPKS